MGAQIVYVYINAMFGFRTIDEMGRVYTCNSLELFMLAVYCLLIGYLVGAEANKLDQEVKRKMMQLI